MYNTAKQKTEETIKSEVVTISPQLAAEWLQKNKNFRALHEYKAQNYARIIKERLWQLNGESIKFDQGGNLIDGQHRLRGVVLADLPITSLVVYGVENAENIDTGTNRTLSQFFSSKGLTNYSRLANVIGILFAFRKFGRFRNASSRVRMSHTEALSLLQESVGIEDSVTETMKSNRIFGQANAHAVLHFLFAEASTKEKASEFYRHLLDGVNLSETNPIYQLRERLIIDRNSALSSSREYTCYLVVQTWNLWLAGQPAKTLLSAVPKDPDFSIASESSLES